MHYVNEKLDSGNTIVKKFYIRNKDNENMLKYKTQKLEYRAFLRQLLKF